MLDKSLLRCLLFVAGAAPETPHCLFSFMFILQLLLPSDITNVVKDIKL